MRTAIAWAAMLLWQTSGAVTTPSLHLRWQREIPVPAAGGPVCAVLDAQVLAHAESRSGDDLRVFEQPIAGETEVPFSLTESEAEPEDVAAATVGNVKVRGEDVDFDLAMPRRLYSSVVLKIAAKNFVGRALVTAKDSGKVLGSFAVFDLSGDGLARSTTLALAESAVPELHVSLRLSEPPHGRGLRVSPAMVQGADVPASREAQTLYTLVAATDVMQATRYGTQVAEIIVPAHVPVERVSVLLDPGFRGEFQRELRVGGVRLATDRSAVQGEEMVRGSIWRVNRQGGEGYPATVAEALGMDAVLGLTLRDAAKIAVEVNDVKDNRTLEPLPIREVRLEMRQRSVCFESEPGKTYLLRYGDAALAAPVYIQMDRKQMGATQLAQRAFVTMLGPERLNASFQPGAGTKHSEPRRVGLIWIVGVGGLVLIWASTHGLIRRRGGRV